jgi:hypothetical protein
MQAPKYFNILRLEQSWPGLCCVLRLPEPGPIFRKERRQPGSNLNGEEAIWPAHLINFAMDQEDIGQGEPEIVREVSKEMET